MLVHLKERQKLLVGTGLARCYGALAARGKRCLIILQVILGNLLLAIEAFYETAGLLCRLPRAGVNKLCLCCSNEPIVVLGYCGIGRTGAWANTKQQLSTKSK